MRDSEYGISEVDVNQIGRRVATGPSHFRPRLEIAAQSTVAADIQYLDPVTAPTQRLSNSPDDDPPSGESIRSLFIMVLAITGCPSPLARDQASGTDQPCFEIKKEPSARFWRPDV